ncbi:hypothetical protein VNO78_16238 [Psophocarpus tetragonolobus]|uniref:Uncharacterized protein n=1 Tax=Psophocarpus tetragonolobus TaxID=3891 RepID=A0AAN9SFF8_PSOTE
MGSFWSLYCTMHGANFATGGSSILPGGYSPFHLGLQISQFIQFKSHTKILFYQNSVNNRTKLSFKSSIPRPNDFSRALYTFDIGQNDLAYGFQHMSEEQVRVSIPNILRQFSLAVQQLYIEGARVFWIHNTGPIGCLPFNFLSYGSKQGNLDSSGCVKPQNEIAQEFNRKLKDQISDYHGYQITCGKKSIGNETVNGNACENASKLVSWDGIHYSQAANSIIAKQIISGAFSDPPVAIDRVRYVNQGYI